MNDTYIEKLKKVYETHFEDDLNTHKEKFKFLNAHLKLPSDFVNTLNIINFNRLNRTGHFFEWGHELLLTKGKIEFENFDQIYQQVKHPTNYIEDFLMLDNDLVCITHNYSWNFGLIYMGYGEWNNGFIYYRANGFLLQVSNSYKEFIEQLSIKIKSFDE